MWSPDGSTLYYIPGAQPVAGVSVTKQPALGFGSPRTWPATGQQHSIRVPRNFDVLPDGKQFVFTRIHRRRDIRRAAGAPQIRVVVNWSEEFRARK